MHKKIVYKIMVMLVFLFPGLTWANNLDNLFKQVETLNIERHEYVLGAELTPGQIKTANTNLVDAASKDTFKFKDKNLYIVAQKTSNRVLVMYEQFKDLSQPKIQEVIGDLYLEFDEPTVMAHDKVVYWAYGEKGKISAKEFDTARQGKKKLSIFATIKLISDVNIMEKLKQPATGQVYYIISSDPLLKFFQK